MMEQNLPKHIHQNRPSLILNIDNEYMTYMLMDEIKRKSVLMLIFGRVLSAQWSHDA
jgi:hypothetical protein